MRLKASWVIWSNFWANLCHSYTKILKRREGKAETWAKWSQVWGHHFQEPTLPWGHSSFSTNILPPSLSFSSSSVTNCIKPLIFFEESLYFSVGGFSSLIPALKFEAGALGNTPIETPTGLQWHLLSITLFRIPAETLSLGSNKCSAWNLGL